MTREEINEEIHKEVEQEQDRERKKRIIKISVKIILSIIILSTIFFTYTTYISTVKVKVREYRIINKKIPDSFNGTKIIQISDLHFGSTFSNNELEKVIKLVNERKPDLIFFTGDLIAKNYTLTTKKQEQLTSQLKKLNASLGKYAILGDEDKENVITLYNQSDFNVLKNDKEFIYKNDSSPILLVGLSSLKQEQKIEQAYQYFTEETHNANIYTIGLLHEPDTVDNILNV